LQLYKRLSTMKAAIYAGPHLIGHADLQPGDIAMGGVYGEFIPTAAYYQQVQQVVWEFTAAAAPDYRRWQALAFSTQLENGYFLLPAGGYEFEDDAEYPTAPKRIYLAGVAAEILEDFIQADPPRTFVEEPWEVLPIAQKLALEAELSLETGNDLRRLVAVGGKRPALRAPQFSALCRFGASDDVLFSVQDADGTLTPFVLVHLTWSGGLEKKPGFPTATFFNSFAEFKLERMYPDRSEWEY
jgi:hypothetical protein